MDETCVNCNCNRSMGQFCSTSKIRTGRPSRPIIVDFQTAKYDDPHPASTNTESSSSTDDNHTPVANAPSPSPSRSCHASITQTYQILPQVAGSGGDGEVRKCVHLRTRQTHAVKTIPINSPRRRNRIQREVAFLKEVNHPNIISLSDFYKEEDRIHIVTEMCHGGELFHKIVEKKELNKMSRSGGRIPSTPCFREREAARIVNSLLLAVSYLHSRDIVHRDIKPENVLFVEQFDGLSPVKLIDFGLAARHPRGCAPLNKRVGTPQYMAPEVLRGSYGRECDLWSVGVVAFLLLSGRQPFGGFSSGDTFERIRRGLGADGMEDSSLWGGVSACAKDFIRCLLVSDPSMRWTAEMALGHPWLEMPRHTQRHRRKPGTKLAIK